MTTSTNSTTGTTDTATSTFHPYAANLPITEVEGFRPLTITYKQTAPMKAKGIEARDNVYCYVPTSTITLEMLKDAETQEKVLPYILTLIQGEQDTILKQYHKDGGCTIYPETVSLDKVLASWEASGNSGLTGELITTWFTDAVAPELTTILWEKLTGSLDTELTPEQEAKIQKVISGYLAGFVSLASGKTQMAEQQRQRLAKALELSGQTNSAYGIKFTNRFTLMEAKEKEALSALGDDLDL